MNQAVQPIINEAKKTVEIVVHVTEGLNEDQRSNLASALKNTNGITDAEFCPLRYHLMLVRYDMDAFSSQDVLRSINSQDVHAQLIGPV
jgi:cell division protein FtsX